MPQIQLKRFSRAKIPPPEVKPLTETQQATTEVPDTIPEPTGFGYIPNEPDDFLPDLNNDVFVSQSAIEKTEKERLKEEKEKDKHLKKEEAQRKKTEKLQKDTVKATKQAIKDKKKEDEDALFSEQGSELYGRDKRELIAKIQQYKVLFPDNKQLKALKIKKNPTVEELQKYVAECEAIIDTDTVEVFITDSILASVKMIEYGSTRTKYNIKGLADMLKANPQFNSLCKQLYLKYRVFSKIPPETQMFLLVTTTAYVCLEKNKQEERNEKLLNKPINLSEL
jgi:cold shock CspA family protein